MNWISKSLVTGLDSRILLNGISVLVFICLKTGIGFAQPVERTVEVLQPQTILLNSTGNSTFMSGKSRQVITFKLPANTVRWYYSFSAFRDEQQLQKQAASFSLLSKLSILIDQTGTSAAALSVIGTPPGTHYCNVYLLSSANEVQGFENGRNPVYNRQGSRLNFVSGVVDVSNSSHSGNWEYLGFENNNRINALSVSLQVVAIVKDEGTLNGWTATTKQALYTRLFDTMTQSFGEQVKKKEVEDICSCIMVGLTSDYTPDKLSLLAPYELKPIFVQYAEKCTREHQIDLTGVVPGQLNISSKDLIGRWKDQNSTFSIFEDGDVNVFFKGGKYQFGTWKCEGNNLEFRFDKGRRIESYIIVELTDRKLRFKGTGADKTLWEAIKQD